MSHIYLDTHKEVKCTNIQCSIPAQLMPEVTKLVKDEDGVSTPRPLTIRSLEKSTQNTYPCLQKNEASLIDILEVVRLKLTGNQNPMHVDRKLCRG